MIFIIAPLIFMVCMEIIHAYVFGQLIPEKELNDFFAVHLETYKQSRMIDVENGYTSQFYGGPLPSICIAHSPLSKWYISDYGSIPRYSKYSKILTKIFNETGGKGKRLTDLI